MFFVDMKPITKCNLFFLKKNIGVEKFCFETWQGVNCQ